MLAHLSQSLPGNSSIISHTSSVINLSSCSSYSGSNERSKLDVESSSITMKYIELFYCLIRRLLFTSKITRPNTHDCVAYLLTIIKVPTIYHKNRNLNTDLLFMKKIRMFVLSSTGDQYTHFELFFYEHNNYILIILQQIIQSRTFKNVSTVLEEAPKNMSKWININLHTDLIKCITDLQEHTTNNTRKSKNNLINQGVKTTSIQYYNTYQESIL